MTHAFGPIQNTPTNGVWHEYANLFPMLDSGAHDELVADIAANGVLEPITVYQGAILDGRNRHYAAGFVHAVCPWREYQGDDALGFVISQNLKRRHLTESQRAMVASKLAKLPQGGDQRSDQSANLRVGMTQAEAAVALNISERSIQTAKVIERDGALELAAAVEAGQVSLSAASEVARLPIEEQQEIVEQGPEAVKEAAKGIRNKRASIGTESHSKEDRGDDLYETGPEALAVLFAAEKFSQTVWEPACGPGNIACALYDQGYNVITSDLRDYSVVGQQVGDFLTIENLAPGSDIVTNPPFGIAQKFAAQAVNGFNAPKVALLLNLNFLAGCNDGRKDLFEGPRPLARVLVLSRRLPMMHRHGWEGSETSSQMNMAWFIWDRTHTGPTTVTRWDWKDFMPDELREAEQ